MWQGLNWGNRQTVGRESQGTQTNLGSKSLGKIQTSTVYTDSQTALDSLKNIKIHTSLIEKIRRKTIQLEQAAWKIKFAWVKAHAGTQGNETADTLAKEAAADMDIAVSYDLIAKSVVK